MSYLFHLTKLFLTFVPQKENTRYGKTVLENADNYGVAVCERAGAYRTFGRGVCAC